MNRRHLVLLLLLAACSAPRAEPASTRMPSTVTPQGSSASMSPTPAATAILGPALYTDSTQPVEARVNDLLGRMTLAEKIGQMTQVEKDGIASGDIMALFI